jgi:hypothetical protein
VFVVPAGITSITVVVVGATGGESKGGLPSGFAQVRGTLGVRPGEKLYVEVGGAGTSAGQAKPCPGTPGCLLDSGGFNGGGSSVTITRGDPGGGGGGASDLQTMPISAGTRALRSRLIVAGGGGGAGGGGAIGGEYEPGAYGGNGGDPGENGTDGTPFSGENIGGGGGDGGGLGNKTVGGKAGASLSSNPAKYFAGNAGGDGQPGVGGPGGGMAQLLACKNCAPTAISGAGGGGGGGIVGGAGGGSGGVYSSCNTLDPTCTRPTIAVGGGGGGGGGSSFTANGRFDIHHPNPKEPANGSVHISWGG